MLSEILEIPERAGLFMQKSPAYSLPMGVPYIGMGSSYFAALAFKYMGINIQPEMASEYYNYLYHGKKALLGVLLSQSGKSSEVLWCREAFEKYVAISNDVASPLFASASAGTVALFAGEEKYSSSKTFINTLLALFKGFGMNVQKAVDLLALKMNDYDQHGRVLADEVFKLLQEDEVNGLYIIGSGANIATAMQAALILSESTKLNFNGMPMAQYDHGPKETAKGSVVIMIIAKGKSYERSMKLHATLTSAGAHVFTVEEPEVTEEESVINNSIPFNYMAWYLSRKLHVQDTFVVGGKVTEVG